MLNSYLGGVPMKLARPPIPPKKRAVRARAWRKEGGWGEEFRHARAETQSGANQAFFVQKRFELRSVIATRFSPLKMI